MTMHKNPWKTLSGEIKYENPWIKVTEYDVITPTGTKGIYGKVHVKSVAIGIIPLDANYNTWLVGQYRYPLDCYSWEIPEGGGNPNTPFLESAKRELLEETGIAAQKWTKVQEVHTSNSITDEFGIVFIAQDLSFHDPDPDDTEDLTLKKLPFEKAYQMVLRNEITDGLAIAGIFKTKWLMDQGAL